MEERRSSMENMRRFENRASRSACIATLQQNPFIQPVMGDWLVRAGKAGDMWPNYGVSGFQSCYWECASHISKVRILNLEF
jgi:hypothetical protein